MTSMQIPHLPNQEERLIEAITFDSQFKQDYEETMRCLSEHRLDANAPLHVHSAVHTPLSLAILLLPEHDGVIPITEENRLCNSPGLVDYLIDHGAYIGSADNAKKNITQPEGAPLPLAFAVKCGKLHIVQQLIHAGAGLDVQGKDGKTALHEAVLQHDRDMAVMLVAAGARTDIEDGSSNTPLAYADKAMKRAMEKARPKPAVHAEETPGRFAQFFEEVGKANSLTHGVPPTIGGWYIP